MGEHAPRGIPQPNGLLPDGQARPGFDQRGRDHVKAGVHLRNVRAPPCLGRLIPSDAADQNQPLPRARQRDVEHPYLLGELLPLRLDTNRAAQQRVAFAVHLRIHARQTHAQLRIHQHPRAQGLPAHPPPQRQHKDDRKFKALALVRRHDAHHVFALADGAGAHAVAARAQPLGIAQKRVERAALRAGKCSRPRGQQMQVRLPRRAARQRARPRQKARFGIDALDQPIHALIARAEPPARALCLKRAQLFGQRVVHLFAIAAHRLMIGRFDVRRIDPNLRQLALLKPQRRAAQGGEQRLIPRAVLDGLQKRRHGANLRDIKIPLARVTEHRNPL